jgi:hypothetical protein
MDVQLTPRPFGCLIIFLGLISFWIIPLVIRSQEAAYAKRLDDEGIATLGGKRIPWSDLKQVQHKRYKMGATGGIIEAYSFTTSKGRVGFLSNRIKNFDEVMRFVWSKVPQLEQTS